MQTGWQDLAQFADASGSLLEVLDELLDRLLFVLALHELLHSL